MSSLEIIKRSPELRIYDDSIFVDFFAGGGGASTGVSAAIGRDPDFAINHDAQAISMHKANHPNTKHFTTDVYEINPLDVITDTNKKIKAWFSPDCTHFTNARGCAPVSERVRGLAWVAIGWAMSTNLTMFALENVEEFKTWGPTIEDDSGKKIPDPKRKGETFKAFIKCLTTGIDKNDPSITEIKKFLGDMLKTNNIDMSILYKGLGYKVEYKTLIAHEYGAPTSRKRFFLIARKDGKAIKWPTPTHSNPECETVKAGIRKPWRTAAECIEWNEQGYSIFESKEEIKRKYGVSVRRPLQDTTLRRIAKGFKKFVLENSNPFVIEKLNNTTTPYLQTYFGETISGNEVATRGQTLQEPLSTITAGGLRHGLITPYLIGIDNKSAKTSEWSLEKPLTTIVTENRHALINASCITSAIVKFKGQNYGHDIKEPLQTVTAQGNAFALTNAFLTKYYGNGENATSINNPMPTATTKDRFSLVNISFANTDLTDEQKYTAWTIVRMLEHFADLKTNSSVLPGPRANAIVLGDKIVTDISLRMLNPKELFRGQGFPEDYIIDAEHNGKPLPKTAQVRMCGNSVPPHLAYHIFKSNVA